MAQLLVNEDRINEAAPYFERLANLPDTESGLRVFGQLGKYLIFQQQGNTTAAANQITEALEVLAELPVAERNSALQLLQPTLQRRIRQRLDEFIRERG